MSILLIFRIRKARLKARKLAIVEALALLADLGATAASGGPLSEQPGVFWIGLPGEAVENALPRLPRLGYSESVHYLDPVADGRVGSRTAPTKTNNTYWRGKNYQLIPLYIEDTDSAREHAPDRRVFVLATPTGEARPVRGYRGDGQALSRRGLPVYDARLLVNLALAKGNWERMAYVGAHGRAPLQEHTPSQFISQTVPVFLDPFAGIGGIVLEALASGCHVLSLDVDPALRLGLAHFGAANVVGDARSLPYPDSSIDAIATEPPYDDEATPIVVQSLTEMARVLKPDGKLAVLCTEAQAAPLREQAAHLPLERWLDAGIDRKGLACALLAWRKITS
jgi:hypothetical protein